MATSVAEPRPDGLPDRFGFNVLSRYGEFAVIGIASLVLTPLMLRELGEEAFGIWALAVSAVDYLELLELGFGVSTTKLVAEDAYRRPKSVARTLNTSFWVLAILGVLGLAVGLVLSMLAPTIFNVPEALTSETVLTFAVLTVAIAVSIPGDVFGGAIAGYQRYDLHSLANIMLVVLTTVSSAVIVISGGGLVELALATATISICLHGVRWLMLKHLNPELVLRPRLVERSRIRRVTSLSGWFLLRDLAMTVNQRIDLVVVGIILGVESVAVYAIGLKLMRLAVGVLYPLAGVFFPHASELSTKGDRDGLRSLLCDGTRTAIVVGLPTTLGLMVLSKSAVRVWVGPGYSDAALVLTVLAASLAFEALAATAWQMLAGVGRARTSGVVASIEAVVNLGCSLILGSMYGVVGVAIGTLAGIIVVKVPVTLALVLRDLEIKWSSFFSAAVLPTLLPGVVSAATFLGARLLFPQGVIGVVLAATAGMTVFFVIYWFTGATDSERDRVRGARRTLSGSRSRS